MKSKDQTNQYAPWEQEEKEKKRREKKSSIPSQTGQKSRVHSKPKTSDQEYLDLYLFAREKERLEKYGKTLGQRQKAIALRWKEVKSSMYNTQKELPPINEEGIEEFLESKQEKERKKKRKKRGNIQRIDWDY